MSQKSMGLWTRANTFPDLMWELQKYARNWDLTMAHWDTCEIAQPIQPIWQPFFSLFWSALNKPPWELRGVFRIFILWVLSVNTILFNICNFFPTVLKCPKIEGANLLFFKIAGAKAPIAPVLNTPLELNYMHIFVITSSSRHEKHFQMLKRLFAVFF